MAHEWSPADLPADFKLFEWDFARNDKVTLDANGGIASIADTWAGRLAVTTSTAARRTLATHSNGVQGAYKPGTSSNTQANGLSLTDTSGLPVGSADRYVGFAVVHADGILGGYGDSSHDYWLDTPFNPGYRVHLEGTTTTNQLSVNRTDPHFVELETISGVTTLWVDGVNAGTYNNVLATTAGKFGIAGYDQSYYTMNGYTFYVPVGKRGRTSNERYLLQAWVAKYKTKRTPPSDNPYRPVAAGGSDLPIVADSGSAIAPDGATQTQTATSPTLASRAGVQPDSATQAVTASSPTIAGRSAVRPDSSSQASTASSPSLASRSSVAPDSAAQQQAVTSPALSSRGAAAPDSATQATQASSPSLSNVRTVVAPDSAAQTQAATQPSLTGAGTVAVDSAAQAQTASSPTVATRSAVQPASATQAQATTSPSLNGRQSVAPDNAAQATLLSSLSVAARVMLMPNSASQQQSATSPTLAAKAFLLVSSALQTQAATSPALFVGERPLPPSTRTVRSIRLSRVVRSPRPSRLAA